MQALHYTRAAQLPDILAQRIVILDGAMGTMIQRFKLAVQEQAGDRARAGNSDTDCGGTCPA